MLVGLRGYGVEVGYSVGVGAGVNVGCGGYSVASA